MPTITTTPAAIAIQTPAGMPRALVEVGAWGGSPVVLPPPASSATGRMFNTASRL
jgi:hypothetical protein